MSDQVYCPWLTLARTRMVHNFSFALPEQNGKISLPYLCVKFSRTAAYQIAASSVIKSVFVFTKTAT